MSFVSEMCRVAGVRLCQQLEARLAQTLPARSRDPSAQGSSGWTDQHRPSVLTLPRDNSQAYQLEPLQ